MTCFSRIVRFVIAAGLAFAAESPAWAQSSATVTIATIPTVAPGGTIPIQCSVTNTGTAATTYNVATEIEQNGNVLIQVNGGNSLPVTVQPNNAVGTVSFNFTVPSGWATGTYTAHAVVRDASDGTYLTDNTQNFTAQGNPPFTGRIAYHVYSSYLATPVNGTDGTIQLYKLPATLSGNALGSQSSQIQNAVNPKFSPDGSKIVFAGVPAGVTPGHASLAVFLYDFADGSLTQLTSNAIAPCEDPNFSPDGKCIVYKRTPTTSLGQIFIMNLGDGKQTQLTNTSDEKSAPCFSPDGTTIAYYSGGSGDLGGSAAEDIWTMSSNGTNAMNIIPSGLESYYPNYRDANTILYTQWVVAGGLETQILAYTISTQTSLGLTTNMAGPTSNDSGYSDADPFPVNQPGTTLVGFSSTRPQNNTGSLGTNRGGNIVYLGDTTSGAVYYLPKLDPNINSSSVLNAEGGTYTPYSYARKLVMQAPTQGTTLGAGTTVLLQVKAWSDGGIWSGASPTVVFQGPGATQYAGLQDDGTGQGIYSATVTLPQATGPYTVYATANSADNGLTNVISSSSQAVQLLTAQTISDFQPTLTLGENQSPYTLPTTTSAGLTVTYSVLSGPATISGDTLTLTGTGTVVLQATQAGNATYAPLSATETITVATSVPAAPRWMLAILGLLLGLVAFRALRTREA